MCARGCRGSRSTKAMDTPEKLVSFETLITDLEISLQGQHISSLNLSPMTPPPPPVRLTEQTHQELGFSLNDFPLISCFIREFFFFFEPLLLFFFWGVMDSFDFDFKWCWSRWWSLVTSSHLGNEAFPSKPSRIWYYFSVLGDLDAEISPENEASPITDLASFRAVGESIWNLTVSFFF